jgi:ubiquitin carboxyl-terminal hydrolase 7
VTWVDSAIFLPFSLLLFGPFLTSPTLYNNTEGSHVFNKKERDRGFSQFTDRHPQDILDPKKGFLKDDTMLINLHIHLCRDWIEHADTEDNEERARSSLYDSKKETSFIGMKNQGATCYLNSLIQSLYHLPILRKAVYLVPTESDKTPAESIPLALQRLFYNLHHSNDPVGTSELTRSFGWTSDEALTQHDVQEFCRKLFEKLEIKMKSTAAEGTIERLFRGTLYNFIKCTEVDYESSRTEDFYDISLNVKGCKDIYESLRKYTEVETLDGDNKYKSDKYGLQTAKKGILFDSFPPVLHLHLKRFEYDFERDQYVKVYDKFFFPATINVKEFLSPNANREVDYTYHLHGVLVHTGTVGAGHYFAFLRPSVSPQWYRFDDGTVSKVSAQKAIDDNFGTVGFDKRSGSAYMLIYVQDSHRKQIFAPLTEKDTPMHLENRFNDDKVKEQMRLNALREEEMYTTVQIATEEVFKHHTVFDLFEDSQLRSLRLKKETAVSELPGEVSKLLDKPVESFRLWRWCRRKNTTVRLDEPLDLEADGRKIVSQLIRGKADKALVLWVEDSSSPAGEPSTFIPFDPKKTCVLSIKLYDPVKSECRFVGHVLAEETDQIRSLVARIRKLLGLADDAPFSLYEEIRPSMIEPVDEKDERTLAVGELGHGDILVAQLPLVEEKSVEYPSPIEYFGWVENRIKVVLKKKDDKKDEGISVWVDGGQSYSVGVKPIGKALNWDSAKLRLTPTVMYVGRQNRIFPLAMLILCLFRVQQEWRNDSIAGTQANA